MVFKGCGLAMIYGMPEGVTYVMLEEKSGHEALDCCPNLTQHLVEHACAPSLRLSCLPFYLCAAIQSHGGCELRDKRHGR